MAYKLDFYRDFFEFCNSFVAEGRAVYVCGDYNTAHHSIDLARPKENEGNSGFLPVERAWMDTLIDDYRYVDTFRAFDNGADRYTWWSYRTAARKRNIGWRIDYCLASQGGMAMIRDAYILDQVQGSDHCPVGIAIEGGGSR